MGGWLDMVRRRKPVRVRVLIEEAVDEYDRRNSTRKLVTRPVIEDGPREYGSILASALNVQAENLGIPVRPGRIDELVARIGVRMVEDGRFRIRPEISVPEGWCDEVERSMSGRLCLLCGQFAYMSDHSREECRSTTVRQVMES